MLKVEQARKVLGIGRSRAYVEVPLSGHRRPGGHPSVADRIRHAHPPGRTGRSEAVGASIGRPRLSCGRSSRRSRTVRAASAVARIRPSWAAKRSLSSSAPSRVPTTTRASPLMGDDLDQAYADHRREPSVVAAPIRCRGRWPRRRRRTRRGRPPSVRAPTPRTIRAGRSTARAGLGAPPRGSVPPAW